MVPVLLLAVSAALASLVAPVAAPSAPPPTMPWPVVAGRREVAAVPMPVVAGRHEVTPVPAGRWSWPLEPEPAVVAPFRAPPTPWGAGHRGVDLAAAVGQPVLSASGGRVTFAGRVAGRGIVVVTHPGNLRTSYEPVDHRTPGGAVVAAGDVLGVVAGTPGHCAPRTCLHWGLRHGTRYADPLTLVGSGPPVLLPLDMR